MKKQSDNKKPIHRFKPGESGNPRGRPKGSGRGIKDCLRRFGEWQCPEALLDKMAALFPRAKRDKLTVAEAVYLRVYVEALQGESWAVQFIAERTEGKVPQQVNLTPPGPVLNITWPEVGGAKDKG